MKILSLDFGTTCGWACYRNGEIQSGTWVHRTPRQAKYEGGGMRFLRFRKNLEEMRDLLGGIDLITFEEVRSHKGTDAAHIYGGFLATLGDFAEQQGIPYEAVGVGTIKRHATGKGNASKYGVIKAMRDKGHAVRDDNEADALAILYWTLEEYKFLL